MKLIKRIIALTLLYVPAICSYGWDSVCAFFTKRSKAFGLDYLELLFFHRYHIRNFKPLQYKESIKVLWRKKRRDWLRADRSGRLYLVKSRAGKLAIWLQNLLTLGAFSCRLERALYLNFLSMCVEFLNPLEEKTLKPFLERKLSYFDRLLEKIERVNGKRFARGEIRRAIDEFERNSLKQAYVIRSIKKACRRQRVPDIVLEAKEGIDSGLMPVLIKQGKSGSYWMRSKDREVLGIFKPFDEEPFAINNPTRSGNFAGFGQRGMRSGIEIGEAAHNEVAAYRVDSFFGFGIVPHTYYASFTHRAFYSWRGSVKQKKKYGSFQEFLEGFVAFPRLPADLRKSFPIDDFQTILFFDLLVGNTDRHMNNLLVGENKLAAIDHGYCFADLPSALSLSLWRGFEQAEKQFHPEIQKLANNFPFDPLFWKLRKNCFRKWESLERMRERLALFRAAVNAELVPQEMAFLFSYENFVALMNQGSFTEEIAQALVDDFVDNKEKRMTPPWKQRWLYL